MLFTSSWDDGYGSDRKIADLLNRYGLKGTFYVCPKTQHDAEMMSEFELKKLAGEHELGAHSMTHPKLTKISLEDAEREMKESKRWLEGITGKPCTMFCYPYGDHNDAVRSLAKNVGFKGARTTEDLKFSSNDPLAMPTTLQIMPFPWRRRFSRWWHPLDLLGPLRARWSKLRSLQVPVSAMSGWLPLAKALFDKAKRENQPFFHLWGHSHEVERLDLWKPLEEFLAYVAKQKVQAVFNSELIS